MTSISPTSSTATYAAIIAKAQAQMGGTSTATTTTTSQSNATNITLSDAAKATLSQKDSSTIIAEVRAALSKLMTDAGVTSPAGLDLSSLDRRGLFAISANGDGTFTQAEKEAAQQELSARFDAALTGPLAVARVTGDMSDLYKAAVDHMDAAGSEERATPTWAKIKAALIEAQKQLLASPDAMPEVDGDPVSDFIARTNAGEAGQLRDFGDVAKDARAALDKQIAAAKDAGTTLVFRAGRRGQLADLTQFSGRSLAAIALNQGAAFSDDEVSAAKAEMKSRSGAALLAGFKNASGGSDPTAFAKNIIAAYASMSSEERTAAGWSEQFYSAALSNYQSANTLAQMLSGSSSGNGSGNMMSLLNYM